MKMRKKLAALLAAAMIASVMPMTAFAATTNHVTTTVKVERGGVTQGRAPELVIDNTRGDVKSTTNRDFYLKLEGAEFLSAGAILYSFDHGGDPSIPTGLEFAAYHENDPRIVAAEAAAKAHSRKHYTVSGGTYNGLEFRLDRDNTLAINAGSLPTAFYANGVVNLPIIAKITDETAKLSVDGAGTGISSFVASVFATTGTSKSTVVIGDVPSIYYGLNEKLAKITLVENFDGAFDSAEVNAKGNLEIEIELDSSDYDFRTHTASNPLKVIGLKGLSGVDAISYYKNAGRDNRTLVVEIPRNAINSGNQAGEIEFVLTVDANTKDPEVGPLKADITSDFFASQTVTLANVAKFGVEIVPKEDYDFVTGQKEKVTFNFNELVADSLVDKRPVEFALPEGVTFTEGSVRIDDKKRLTGDKIFYGGDQLKNDDPQIITVYLDSDRDKLDKFKIEAEIQIESSFKGDIELTATGRAVEEAVSAVLAKTTPPVKVTVEPIQVKAGLKVQTGGKIVIEETDKGRFMSGNDIVIALEKESGMTLKDAKVVVTSGDLKTDDVDVKEVDGELRIRVKRRSKVASTIELTDIEIKIDRSVPIGNYEVKVGGPAISKLATDGYTVTKDTLDIVTVADVDANGNIVYVDSTSPSTIVSSTHPNAVIRTKQVRRKVGEKVEAKIDPIVEVDFLLLGDPILGLKSTVVFTIGDSKYTVDGIEHTMDASAYIKDGRTMVPVRYLADALGVAEENIKFNAGIVTIFVDNGNVVQLKVNSKDLVTNGMTIPMVAAAEIIEGRTYVPVTEIGAVFGVTGTWDSAAQTATFAK